MRVVAVEAASLGTGACFTGFVTSESASWQSKQTVPRGCVMSPAKFEEWAAWQERQLPCRITVWTDFDWSLRAWQP